MERKDKRRGRENKEEREKEREGGERKGMLCYNNYEIAKHKFIGN